MSSTLLSLNLDLEAVRASIGESEIEITGKDGDKIEMRTSTFHLLTGQKQA